MKRIIQIALLLSLFAARAVAQEEGIAFFHNGEWDKAVAKAKAENKLIFMDAYTVWCGPCKMMAKQTFPVKEVADLYNARFVNVKMDMEKGEGIELAQKFGVMAYPTLLFIDPADLSIAHRTAGFHAAAEFVQLGQTALDPAKRTASMDRRFASGDRDPEFLRAYAAIRAAAFDGSHQAVAEEYLKTQTDWGTPENLKFIFENADKAGSAGFKYLCQNKAKFIAAFGEQKVIGRIEDVVMQSVEGDPNRSLADAQAIFRDAYPEKGDLLASRYAMTYYRQRGEREAFAQAAVSHFAKYPSKDPDELNEAAWTFYRVVEDPKMLKNALGWAKKSVKLGPSFYNYDTLAALSFKLGQKKSARRAATKAIKLAREMGEDYSQTQELLDKINAL